ncbi:MAG TPA: hypothetical protein VE987_15285 [Polyangiaceae bacterium]|nr:hypothetical protein [Polyangiaceae bacterium]
MRTRCTRSRRSALLVGTFILTGCSARESSSQSPLGQSGAPPAPVDTASPSPGGSAGDTPAPDGADASAGDAPGDGGASAQADGSRESSVGPVASGDASAGDAASAGDGGGSKGAPPGAPVDCGDDPFDPRMLACTGLYDDWPTRTISAGVRAFSPGTELWSDGADKSRYIYLPPGTRIDTTNFDEWSFPVGTKLWKEFRLNGQRVETRFLWKRADGWFRTTYAWSLDGASAIELTTGQTNWNGTTYEIPDQSQCTLCHMGAADGVLGFEAVGLAEPSATGLTLSALVGEGLLTQPPPGPIAVPGNATESAALAWLHANCGLACHNRTPAADAFDKGLFLRLGIADLASVQTTDAWKTAVGQPSGFQPDSQSMMLLIAPGDVANSAIYFRDSHRDAPDAGTKYQMPPIDTHVVPADGVALVAAWIQSMR